jgi:hypothetical protein
MPAFLCGSLSPGSGVKGQDISFGFDGRSEIRAVSFPSSRGSGTSSFHIHVRLKPYSTIQSNITPHEVAAVSFVIPNLNNVLNNANFDLRVIYSTWTREFDGFYDPVCHFTPLVQDSNQIQREGVKKAYRKMRHKVTAWQE